MYHHVVDCTSRGRVRLCALVATLALSGLMAGHAGADRILPPEVPTDLVVPAGNKVFLVAHAVGTQNYTCTGGAWGPAVPDAQLFGNNGHQIGTHYAGPTWEFLDGSTAVATRMAAAPVPGAIPWLLLRVVSTTTGPDGDRFTSTTYIQRVNTTGGTAPAGSCTDGATANVPYTADYYFYRAGSDNQ